MYPHGHRSPRPKYRVSYWLKRIFANTFTTSKTTLYKTRVNRCFDLTCRLWISLNYLSVSNLLARTNSYPVCYEYMWDILNVCVKLYTLKRYLLFTFRIDPYYGDIHAELNLAATINHSRQNANFKALC